MKMQSLDVVNDNMAYIAKRWPECLTEAEDENGKLCKVIDFDKLRQVLSTDAISDKQERYLFTWPDKRHAIRMANTPTNSTLRPVVNDETTPTGKDSKGNKYCSSGSVDFDNTQNLYIEGDNLEVLKLLRESYLGKVKMIYVDPPYNTGGDFVYRDNFIKKNSDYADISGAYDAEGNQLVNEFDKNADSNGRFHTDWLNMIYPRLKIARDLLSEDGVIFISIDDHEVHNLRKVCDEVFGGRNFVAEFIWRGGRRNASKFISTSHEYILFYTKDLVYCNSINIDWNEKKEGLGDIFKAGERFLKESNGNYNLASDMLKSWFRQLPDTSPSKAHSHYSWIDKNGIYFASDISRGGGGGPQWNVRNPTTGNLVTTPSRGWAYSKLSDLEEDISKGLIHFNGDGVPCKKRYLKDNSTQLKETVFYKDRRGASKRLRNLFDSDVFPFPKDEEIIKEFVETFALSDSLILDFFSGSSTTAHAVMQLNAEDGGNRKYIMVQLPETTDEKSEAHKAGYKNICEIGKERIRRAGKKIKEDHPEWKGDTGFRVLKVDTSNMEDVYYTPSKTVMQSLFADNIKADRTDKDLLFQVMMELGIPLSEKIKKTEIQGKTVWNVGDGFLVACFESNVTEEAIATIAKLRPQYFVIADRSLANDDVADNLEQLFEEYSPATKRRIL